MTSTLRFCAIVLTLAGLAACGGGGGPADVPAPPVVPAVPPPTTSVVEVEISGLGTGQVTSSMVWPGAGGGRKSALQVQATALSNLAQGLDFRLQSAGVVDVGARGAGGMRYITATYDIRNAQSCATAGTCTAYTAARKNLTFLGVITPTSINNTAISNFVRFDNSAASPALAAQLLPTHGMDSTGTAVLPESASLQLYREAELPAADPSVTSVLPWGFVVRNVNDGGRTLPASPASGRFDGRITFAFKLPLQALATDDAFKISMRFQVTEDSTTRVTQSAEETGAAGAAAMKARAAALGATDLAVPCAEFSQLLGAGAFCHVRVAGLPANPTARLNPGPANPTVIVAPAGLEALAADTAVNLGISHAMNAPTTASLMVHGSQSGLRRLTGPYAGVLDGGGSSGQPNQLIFRLRPTDRPFFRGETVSFTATAGNRSTDGAALKAFAGAFRVQGAVAGSAGTFPGLSLPAGFAPRDMAVGDLNGDGRPDLVVANAGINSALGATLSVYLGNGSGGFSGPVNLPATLSTRAVALGDLNRDGRLDIVSLASVINTSASVSVYLGDGQGGFTAGDTFNLPDVRSNPLHLAVGEVVGVGGGVDIVTANFDGTVTILAGNGAGGVALINQLPTSPGSNFVVLRDMNSDGLLDIVTANSGSSNSVTVLLTAGAGSGTYAVGTSPQSVAVADVNGDFRPDLLVANWGSGSVSVLLGAGQGQLDLPQNFAVGTAPESAVWADVNADGRLDIVAANGGSNNLSVLLNTGSTPLPNGSTALGFNPQATYALRDSPITVAAAELGGDGQADLLVLDSSGVTVVTGQGTASFANSFAVRNAPRGVALGDLNADGRLDMVVANSASSNLSVLLGDASAGFTPIGIAFPVGATPSAVALADINGDGILDVLTANEGGNSVTLLFGNGSGGLSVAIPVTVAVGAAPAALAVGDVNGDGRMDVVVANTGGNSLSVAVNNGSGGFAPAIAVPVGSNPAALALGDVDNDGLLDVVVGHSGNSNFQILRGDGTGRFTPSSTHATGAPPRSLVLGDVNGDGKLDVVVSAREVNVYLGNGAGSIDTGTAFGYRVGTDTREVVLGDLNGDGRPDIVAVDESSHRLWALLNIGNGRYGTAVDYLGVGTGPRAVALGDVNGDGRLDAVAAGFRSNDVSILIGK